MKETVIYGGAFNPPTNAHLAITKAALAYCKDNQADFWLLPSGSRRDKTIGITNITRMALARALLGSVPTEVATHICTLELRDDTLTETTNTRQALTEQYPDRSFRWIFGSDSVNCMRTWRGGDMLLRTLPMLVVMRPGYALTAFPADMQVLEVDAQITSSTEVRRRLQVGVPVDHLVPAAVLPLLNEFMI